MSLTILVGVQLLTSTIEEEESFIPVKEDNYNELQLEEKKVNISKKEAKVSKHIEDIDTIKDKDPLPIVKKKKPKKPSFAPNTSKSNISTINQKGGVKKTIISFDAPTEIKPKAKPIYKQEKKEEAKKEKPIKPVKFTFKFDDDDDE